MKFEIEHKACKSIAMFTNKRFLFMNINKSGYYESICEVSVSEQHTVIFKIFCAASNSRNNNTLGQLSRKEVNILSKISIQQNHLKLRLNIFIIKSKYCPRTILQIKTNKS